MPAHPVDPNLPVFHLIPTWRAFFSFQALSLIPPLASPFLGISLVFMLLYVWSRELPDVQVNLYGLVALKVRTPSEGLGFERDALSVLTSAGGWRSQAFYLPWAMLALDVIFGSPILPDLLGIVAGHVYYFLTVLHPLSTGQNLLKTPLWLYPSPLTFLFMMVWFYLANGDLSQNA